ncbi:MAG: molybdopterin oxidoreductase, partial [Acidimicrobiia bacterium]|nr:molybdopterin oxidoreductase [Acidimicrobiia bacterium]
LGQHFFGGNVDAGWEHQLAPSGVTLEQLRSEPGGVRLDLETRHKKYSEPGPDGVPGGFGTPSGLVELYVEAFLDIGQPPLPTFTEPSLSDRSRPEFSEEYPLVLSCAKSLYFCETQHRQVPSLRRHSPEPKVELHPDVATARGIVDGQWVEIVTPLARVRARASLDGSLAPGVVFGEHGWFEPCEELDLAGYPPFGPGSANLNLALAQTPSDPISGSSPLRSQVCEIVPLDPDSGVRSGVI